MRRLPGTHPANIKNRSSKHLGWLCGPGHKPLVRSMSSSALHEVLKRGNEAKYRTDWYYECQKEINRRLGKTKTQAKNDQA